MNPSKESISRFHGMYEIGDNCWEWKATKDKDGYGRMRIGGRAYARAHRLSWLIFHGDPGKLLVCHTCDNPSCVRPSHLFLGTALDNNRDRVSKGRSNGCPGEKSGTAKLKEAQVSEVFSLYESGTVRQIDLAKKYGVSQSAIQLILSGKNWKHNKRSIKDMRSAPKKSLRILPDDTRKILIEEYRSGKLSQDLLAKKYGVSQQYVSLAVRS